MDRVKRSPSVLRHLWGYMKAAGYGWWLVAAAILAFWNDFVTVWLVRVFPGAESLGAAPGWLLASAAVFALLAGPFVAWSRLKDQLDQIANYSIGIESVELRLYPQDQLRARAEITPWFDS